jgi:phosphoribosylanthranilate isomerase
MSFLVPTPDGRTRIKLCGLSREEDVDTAIALEADAVGFVFYPPSPRLVSIDTAARLAKRLPPSITAVGLFVDAPRSTIEATIAAVGLGLVQFHGDETPADCAGYRVPFLKAARMTPELDLLAFADRYAAAAALLLDAHSDAYGGAGKVFDWSLVPPAFIDSAHRFGAQAPQGGVVPRGAPRVVLSGGLNARNVAGAIERLRPYAVDVSSGIEREKGVKDPQRMRDFVAAVRAADLA